MHARSHRVGFKAWAAVGLVLLGGCASHSTEMAKQLDKSKPEFQSKACQQTLGEVWIHQDIKNTTTVATPLVALAAGPLSAIPLLVMHVSLSAADRVDASTLAQRCGAPAPDVISIGEMRDLETAQIAVQASLTGHLVLATLHTNDSVSAVTRLTDMGVEPFLLSSSLLGVLAQRLVRKVCTSCGGAGCEACGQTGYQGRTGIFELLVADETIQGLIHSKAAESELLKAGARGGLRLGNASLVDSMVNDGLWDPYNNQHMGNCAELCAKEKSFTREAQDEFAIASLKRAQKANTEGWFAWEITPIAIKAGKDEKFLERDEQPFKANLEKIPALKGFLDPAHHWAKVEALRQFAAVRGITMVELAIGWLLSEPVVASVIAGATTPDQI